MEHTPYCEYCEKENCGCNLMEQYRKPIVNTRETLIKEIMKYEGNSPEIADFIISREQALLDEIAKPLNTIGIFIDNDKSSAHLEVAKRGKAITEAISIINRRKDG